MKTYFKSSSRSSFGFSMAFNIHHVLHLSSEVFYFFSIFIEPFEFNKHRINLRQKLNIHHISKKANQLSNFFCIFLTFCIQKSFTSMILLRFIPFYLVYFSFVMQLIDVYTSLLLIILSFLETMYFQFYICRCFWLLFI